LFSVSGDEGVATSVSEGSETLDHRMEEAQKRTPALPHFQYTRASFKINMNRNISKLCEYFMFREMHNILLVPPWGGGPVRHRLPQYLEWV
jgi:hypothetical protein